MKVEVLTLVDVKIEKFRWWSNWIDIAVFDHNINPFLLQMRISRTNSKSFRCRRMCFAAYDLHSKDVGDLTQMGGGK